MFFPERIQSINPGDRVLEVGPGGHPHPRADCFLERVFLSADAAKGQRGHAPPMETDKPIFLYEGKEFPFTDDEFDYVICSHVLEHVENVDAFIHELTRVSRRGYLEFPTVYYDYLYDFPEHPTLVMHREGTIYWMPKSDSCLAAFRPLTSFFYRSLEAGIYEPVDALKPWLFQGFEWERDLHTQRTRELVQICYQDLDLNLFHHEPVTSGSWLRRLWRRERQAA